MSTFNGKVAVITGAGSGIGRALALALAERGARLALSDVNIAGVQHTATAARAHGARVECDRVDIADHDAVQTYANTVADRFGVVHQVYNNAGIEHHGAFAHADIADLRRVMDVNYWGVVHGSMAFLPHLIASGDGHLINMSSLFGLMAVPGQSAYTASKFAVRGFTEALREEMLVARHRVQVTCVHPSGVSTPIARNATVGAGEDHAALADFYDRSLAKRSATQAAEIIVGGVAKNKPRVIVGGEAKLLDAVVRVLGPAYQRGAALVVSRALSRQQPGAPA
ncbi:SDR family NAD(P)-dependent oxidoreductase [Mycobacterium colombiense]|uniref:Acetoin dehydrogenase n=1 Tax=Mycobacterium colombiense TaxID=339268 RepID=A0A1A2YNY5_9MYCO|nr:SDR family NAD(P)-dependent oxidoreductase [Mycobacterium colombiense]OBI39715.1 acetoin dehydrogenase [Mycobacterium colombiense]